MAEFNIKFRTSAKAINKSIFSKKWSQHIANFLSKNI